MLTSVMSISGLCFGMGKKWFVESFQVYIRFVPRYEKKTCN